MQTGEANGRDWRVCAGDRVEGQFAASLRIAARNRVVVIVEGCRLEHLARGEDQIGPDDHRRDCEIWRVACLDREMKIVDLPTAFGLKAGNSNFK